MLLDYLESWYHVGPLNIHLLGVFAAIGILVGMWLAGKLAAERGMNQDTIYEGAVVAVVGGLVGARLLSVALSPSIYLTDPLRILQLHQGGLAIQGGLAGGVLAAVVYFRIRKGDFWSSADCVAPSLAIAEAIGRFGCDVVGVASASAPWPRIVGGIAYHNLPLYSFAANMLVFAVLWRLRGKLLRGNLFLLYLALYGATRAVIDYFRGSQIFLSVLSPGQIGSLVLLVVAVMVMARRNGGRLKGMAS